MTPAGGKAFLLPSGMYVDRQPGAKITVWAETVAFGAERVEPISFERNFNAKPKIYA